MFRASDPVRFAQDRIIQKEVPLTVKEKIDMFSIGVGDKIDVAQLKVCLKFSVEISYFSWVLTSLS